MIICHIENRTRVNNSYSEWLAVMFGVPVGSILGPRLINIYVADLFFIRSGTDISNFADYNIPYLSVNNVEDVIGSLE